MGVFLHSSWSEITGTETSWACGWCMWSRTNSFKGEQEPEVVVQLLQIRVQGWAPWQKSVEQAARRGPKGRYVSQGRRALWPRGWSSVSLTRATMCVELCEILVRSSTSSAVVCRRRFQARQNCSDVCKFSTVWCVWQLNHGGLVCSNCRNRASHTYFFSN